MHLNVVVKRCFLDSLPINWDNLIPDLLLPFQTNPSTNETGVIFEISRFVSKVVVLLSDELSEMYTRLLTEGECTKLLKDDKSWIAKIARVYDHVTNVDDSRATEHYIRSSEFLSSNDMCDKVKFETLTTTSVMLTGTGRRI